MTTFVAMIGLMPAALSHGIGSETQKPLAIVVIGGALMLAILPRLLQPRAAGAGPHRRAPLDEPVGRRTGARRGHRRIAQSVAGLAAMPIS